MLPSTHVLHITLFATLMLLTSCKEPTKTPDSSADAVPTPEIEATPEAVSQKPVLLFYGNSLTAGYGLEQQESFPSLIQDRIDSLGLDYQVVNAGLSGETTSGGLQRLDWVLRQQVDIFALELGANDMLRGLPLEQTRTNLAGIIDGVRAQYPEATILILEMLAAPNMGADYQRDFKQIYTDLAIEKNVQLVPFFLDGVAGNPDLLLPDGKHPNADGQRIVANNIWKAVQPLL